MLRMVLLPPREILQTHPILNEHLKLRRIRDVCTLYTWVFVSDSLLHMLPYKIQKMKYYSYLQDRINTQVVQRLLVPDNFVNKK